MKVFAKVVNVNDSKNVEERRAYARFLSKTLINHTQGGDGLSNTVLMLQVAVFLALK